MAFQEVACRVPTADVIHEVIRDFWEFWHEQHDKPQPRQACWQVLGIAPARIFHRDRRMQFELGKIGIGMVAAATSRRRTPIKSEILPAERLSCQFVSHSRVVSLRS
jgi:hypothetical protein